MSPRERLFVVSPLLRGRGDLGQRCGGFVTTLCSHMGQGAQEKFSIISDKQHTMFQGRGADGSPCCLDPRQRVGLHTEITVHEVGRQRFRGHLGSVCLTSPGLKYAYPLIANQLERNISQTEMRTLSHTHTHRQACTHAHMHIYTLLHTHTRHAHRHAHAHTGMHTYIHTHTHKACTHSHAHAQAQVCTRAHIHT